MIKLSNEVKERFINYANAHNEQRESGELFDLLYEQLENEYDFQTTDKIIDILCTCGRSKAGHDVILIDGNLNNFNIRYNLS